MRDEKNIEVGSIQIHKKVIEDICRAVIDDIQGVSLLTNKVWNKVLEVFGAKHTQGIDVTIDKENRVIIFLKVKVQYGLKIPQVASHIQDAVREAVERIAEIDLQDVNVNIQGMERGEL